MQNCIYNLEEVLRHSSVILDGKTLVVKVHVVQDQSTMELFIHRSEDPNHLLT